MKRKMVVRQKLIAKINLFYGWNTQFLARNIQNTRKNELFFGLFSGKNKKFAKH